MILSAKSAMSASGFGSRSPPLSGIFPKPTTLQEPQARTHEKPARWGEFQVERARLELATSGLQIPGFEARLGQVRSVRAKLCWLGEVEIGYSGTRFGTRF